LRPYSNLSLNPTKLANTPISIQSSGSGSIQREASKLYFRSSLILGNFYFAATEAPTGLLQCSLRWPEDYIAISHYFS